MIYFEIINFVISYICGYDLYGKFNKMELEYIKGYMLSHT